MHLRFISSAASAAASADRIADDEVTLTARSTDLQGLDVLAVPMQNQLINIPATSCTFDLRGYYWLTSVLKFVPLNPVS